MAFVNWTYWGGTFECCDECPLEPCLCCCYNRSNENVYDASDPTNITAAVCSDVTSFEDYPDFDAWDCTAPTSATCDDLDDKPAYDAYSCSGDVLTTGDISLDPGGAYTSAYSLASAGDNDMTLEWGALSCHPSARWYAEARYRRISDGLISTTFFESGDGTTHFSQGSINVNSTSGYEWVDVKFRVDNPDYVPASGFYRVKICFSIR